MSTPNIARAPRQAALLATIAGLHVGVAILAMDGLRPQLEQWLQPLPPVIHVLPPPPKPLPVAPRPPGPVDYTPATQPEPDVAIPVFEDTRIPQVESHASSDRSAGSGPDVPVPEIRGPSLRMRDSRLAALIDACYPASSRRLSEEGRVVVKLRIDARGRVTAWNIAEGSGFARLDAAVECVVRRLEFVPGRRDGEAVEASALLPILFRLD